MAKSLHRLTAKEVENAAPGTALNDGAGLFYRATSKGSGRWTFKFTSSDPAYLAAQAAKGSTLRQREMGLGPFPSTGLATAREKAADARALVGRGVDPIAEAARLADAALVTAQAIEVEASAMTFGRYAQEVYLPAVLPGFTHPAHIQQWQATFRTYTAKLNDKRLRDVTRADVLAVIGPIWTGKNVTASRVRERIERLIAHATQNGQFDGDNPAAWGLFDATLSRSKTLVRHHASIPHDDMPAFVTALRARQAEGVTALVVEWIILTACRSGDARNAVWGEIDLTRKVWSVPAVRMKMKRDHSAPITSRMAEILERAMALHLTPPGPADLIFPGPKGKALSDMAGVMLLRGMKGYEGFTVHGFRASFKGWAATETEYARELIEEQLAHQLGAVERAYMRTSAIERRRAMMAGWQAHVAGETPAAANVLPFKGTAGAQA